MSDPNPWIPVLSGLGGVLVGGIVTPLGQWFLQTRREKGDAKYLGAMVGSRLDRLVIECAQVVADDGSEGARDNPEGNSHTSVKDPMFILDDLKVEWKTISGNLLAGLFDLVQQCEYAKSKSDWMFGESSPPDFDEGFVVWHEEFGKIGLAAAQLASDLRKEVGLPQRVYGDWSPLEIIRERLRQLEAKENQLLNQA